MSGGGGGRSQANTSTSTVNTTTQVSTSNVDNSVLGDGAISAGDNARITVTDFGAVDAGMDIASESLMMAGETVEEMSDLAGDLSYSAFNFVGEQNLAGLDFLAEQLNSGRELTRQGMRESALIASSMTPAGASADFNNYIKYGALVVVGLGALYISKKG